MRLFSSRGLLGIAQIASVLFIVLSGYLLHQFDKRSSINEAQSTLLMEKSHVSSFLVGEFSIVEMLGRAVAATASRFPDMSQQDFALLAQSIRADRVEIVNIAFAPDMVVEYVYPFAENRTVMGLDYRADTPFGVGVDQAISTGQTVLVGPIELVQGGEAMILRIPVKTDPATGSEMNSIISLELPKK